MASCGQPNDHRQLVSDILAPLQQPQASRNYYDIQRLPGYKTHKQHLEHREKVIEVLTACNCDPDAKRALQRHTLNWITWLSTPALKAVTDNVVDQQQPLLTSPPIPAPTQVPRPSLPQAPLAPSGWNLKFNNVEGRPSLDWRKHVPRNFCRHIENTFWVALAHSLWGNDELWAVLKATTWEWYHHVIIDPRHPRHHGYTALDAYATARAIPINNARAAIPPPDPLPPLAGSFERQLAPSSQPAHASAELWQVVADAHRIELMVVSAHPRADKRLPIITRGDLNARQVFLLREQDGEYISIRPEIPDIYNFRFDYHRPLTRVHPARTRKVQAEAEATELRSNQNRCPYLKTRGEGDGVNVEPPVVIPGNHGCTPANAKAPEHILSEAAWVQWSKVTAQQVDRYVNSGEWR